MNRTTPLQWHNCSTSDCTPETAFISALRNSQLWFLENYYLSSVSFCIICYWRSTNIYLYYRIGIAYVFVRLSLIIFFIAAGGRRHGGLSHSKR